MEEVRSEEGHRPSVVRQEMREARRIVVWFVVMIVAMGGGGLGAAPVWAQDDGRRAYLSLERIRLRQSFQTPSTRADPAVISFSAPTGAPDTYAVNAAVGYALEPDVQATPWQLFATVEYHRSNELEKEQNTLILGLDGEVQHRDIGYGSGNGWTPITVASVDYKHDRISRTYGTQTSAHITPLLKRRPRQIWRPNQFSEIGPLRTRYVPYVGFEHEYVWSADGDDATTGHLVRGVGRIHVDVTPRAKAFRNRFELTARLAVRCDAVDGIDRALDGSGRVHPHVTTGVTYYFVKSDDGAVGLHGSYTAGEDPSLGFANQELVRVALSVRV